MITNENVSLKRHILTPNNISLATLLHRIPHIITNMFINMDVTWRHMSVLWRVWWLQSYVDTCRVFYTISRRVCIAVLTSHPVQILIQSLLVVFTRTSNAVKIEQQTTKRNISFHQQDPRMSLLFGKPLNKKKRLILSKRQTSIFRGYVPLTAKYYIGIYKYVCDMTGLNKSPTTCYML